MHGEDIIRFFDRVVRDGRYPNMRAWSHIGLPIAGRSGNARPIIARTVFYVTVRVLSAFEAEQGAPLRGLLWSIAGCGPLWDSALLVYYNPFWVSVSVPLTR